MVSIKHQFILDCIVRKMRQLGFEPISLEGHSTLTNSLKIPIKVIRHRPDVIGSNINYQLCIGEAKTCHDIESKRTKEQIVDYSKSDILTIIGCPNSAYKRLSSMIKNLVAKNNIILLKIPDELMPNDEI